jgi:ParB family protein of integrating conjugative element (PFGI_1 class)
MVDITPDSMAAKLLAEGFKRHSPDATAMSDPIADTSMVVTLEQLQPYDLNPRITRNPLYEEIKASIHERGLDAPPAITRRPGAAHFIIRNGGNTRLAILRELWRETKEERFFRIQCMFRPWPERGEIVALTGHLAENELHGGLTFIERALGIEKARELYELERAKVLSQSELARRLAADGFPVPQPHISRMQEAVRYLLPAIPTVLYAGLGRPQVEKLVVLRKAGLRVWERRAADKRLTVDFPDLFQDVLASFDSAGEAFSVKRVQDELVGQLADQLDASYDILMLELDEGELWQRTLDRAPASSSGQEVSVLPPDAVAGRTSPVPPQNTEIAPVTPAQNLSPMSKTPSASLSESTDEKLQAHTVSPASSTDRLQEIQRMVAERTGEAMTDFASNVLQAIPVQVGGVYPISDIWLIAPALDAPEPLRIHIEQLAHEIADEANLPEHIHACEDGIGYRCSGPPPEQPFTRAVFALLSALSQVDRQIGDGQGALPDTTLQDDLAPLLEGSSLPSASEESRLSDASLVKLFRLIRLARRLLDLDTGETQ